MQARARIVQQDERSDAAAPVPFVYDDAALPVRDDLVAAHRRTWDYLARPGAWWTGAERVAIAAEVRRAPACALCRARKDALSPYAVPGTHDSGGGALPETAVDVVHRVVTDPARLARPWCEAAQAELGDGRYVELVGVLVSVLSIDAFDRGVGRPAEPLPAPRAGAPARRRPPAAVRDEAWVAMIPAAGLTAAERDLWTMRHPPNVLRALSLVPDEVRRLQDLSAACYLRVEQVADARAGGARAISRPQMELLAGRVSALNECFY